MDKSLGLLIGPWNTGLGESSRLPWDNVNAMSLGRQGERWSLFPLRDIDGRERSYKGSIETIGER
jgi:hypothetical protein